MSTFSPSGVKTKTFAYEGFQGLDTSRDITSLDTGKEQHLAEVINGFCDWRGQIVRDPSATFRSGTTKVIHVNHFKTGGVFYAEEDGFAVNFKSDDNHYLNEVYPKGSVITSTVFNSKVQIASSGRAMYKYDGASFTRNTSTSTNILLPSFVTSVQRRLAIAGIGGSSTEVHLSRVDFDDIFPGDEEPDDTNVLRAGKIDVGNLLGTADRVTALGSFEQNRLVIFTADRALVYKIDPNIDLWTIDDSTYINIGCASHNTIANAGTDLIFCSRGGIHSIKRSEENGILVYSYSMSDKIDLLYRELFDSVSDPQKISAVFDQDTAHYNVFFPQSGDEACKRLTLALNPEGGKPQPKFSTGDFLQARCGSFLAGQLVYGTIGGIYDINKVETELGVHPVTTIVTPLLWHGSLSQTKETYSVILQAAGKGTITMDAQDLDGNQIGSLVFEVDDDTDDNHFTGVALSKQYERKWSHRYKAAQYSFKIEGGSGLLRIIGFAVQVKG